MDWGERWEVTEGGWVWSRMWKLVGWRTRRRIKKAVHRGEAVEDLDHAAIAVGYVRSLVTKSRSGLFPLPWYQRDWKRATLAGQQLTNAEERNIQRLKDAQADSDGPG
jgi:hypothetical protein